MNRKIFLLFFLFVFGCANIEEMNLNIANLHGYKISKAVEVLGNPTNSVELEKRRIFTWVSSGTMNIPMGGYDYGSDAYGNPVSTWNPNQDNVEMPLGCKITIYTSKNFVIFSTVVKGDGIQCNAYDEKLKKLRAL